MLTDNREKRTTSPLLCVYLHYQGKRSSNWKAQDQHGEAETRAQATEGDNKKAVSPLSDFLAPEPDKWPEGHQKNLQM